ncbi:MAG: carboxylating nicotinate-nucleotide diphosphorylase [Patescibacteria group bacterium]
MKLFAKQIAELNLRNREYRDFVAKLLGFLLKADLGEGDLTTKLLSRPRQKVRARVVAKSSGILAGVAELKFFWEQNGIRILSAKKDGAKIKKGDLVLEIAGPAEKILAAERVGLNLLGRMSGVATAAEKLARKIGRGKFAATRKTPLGILDSRAVVVGGGLPHRLNLGDQILVKENHRAVEANCWQKIPTGNVFEIEADSPKLALEIATRFANAKNLILMLDNFSIAQFRKTAVAIRKINPRIILEASGGVDEKSAGKFLRAGADFVSLGKLTNSVAVVDFSLKILTK